MGRKDLVRVGGGAARTCSIIAVVQSHAMEAWDVGCGGSKKSEVRSALIAEGCLWHWDESRRRLLGGLDVSQTRLGGTMGWSSRRLVCWCAGVLWCFDAMLMWFACVLRCGS